MRSIALNVGYGRKTLDLPMTSVRPTNIWTRLDPPTKVIAAVVGTAAILGGALIGVLGNPFADDPGDVAARKDPAAIAARQIQRCMAKHHLSAQSVMVGGPLARRFEFKRCDWPPAVATSADGFSQVVDTILSLPKYNAASYNTVDTFRADCDSLEVTFVLDHMNGRQFVTGDLDVQRVFLVGFRRHRNRPVLVIDRLDRVPDDVRLPLPTPTSRSFYVLRSGHIALFEARCRTADRPKHS